MLLSVQGNIKSHLEYQVMNLFTLQGKRSNWQLRSWRTRTPRTDTLKCSRKYQVTFRISGDEPLNLTRQEE